MKVTIVTGAAATGKTTLVNRMTAGLKRLDYTSVRLWEAAVCADETPDVVVFDGVGLDYLIELLRAERLLLVSDTKGLYRKLIGPKTIKGVPMPDIIFATNAPYKAVIESLDLTFFAKPRPEVKHIHLECVI